jgi:hypothetical protein
MKKEGCELKKDIKKTEKNIYSHPLAPLYCM